MGGGGAGGEEEGLIYLLLIHADKKAIGYVHFPDKNAHYAVNSGGYTCRVI